MKYIINRIITEHAVTLIVVGSILISCSMAMFAWVRWPDAFRGLIGTFL